jgi:hypothetical protein
MYNNSTGDIGIGNLNINNTKDTKQQLLKQLLDVYYCIDLDDTQDKEYIARCLNLNIRVNQKQFELNKFEYCNINIQTKENDVIKRGLLTFNKMFKQLKLKGNNEIWFVYISRGDIKQIYKNAFVTLVNKNPSIKTCSYAINKSDITINKIDDKYTKLNVIKEINKTFIELFCSENNITYTNLFET